jgi:hypothetical protein
MKYIDTDRIKRVIKRDKTVWTEIRDDKGATLQCVLTVVAVILLNVLASSLVSIIQSPSTAVQTIVGTLIAIVGLIILGPIIVSIAVTLGAIIPHIIAKMLGGKSSFIGYIKVLCYVFVLNAASAVFTLFNVIPVVGALINLSLSLILTIVIIGYTIIATREAHELSTGRAALAVLIPVAIAIIIVVVLVAIMGVALFSIYSTSGAEGFPVTTGISS